MAGMTQREKAALDNHLTTEPTEASWEEPWNTVKSDGAPAEEVIYVTKTVATIVRSDTGTLHPVEAAFVAIAQDDSDGRFVFTKRNDDGSMGQWIVTVERKFFDKEGGN